MLVNYVYWIVVEIVFIYTQENHMLNPIFSLTNFGIDCVNLPVIIIK